MGPEAAVAFEAAAPYLLAGGAAANYLGEEQAAKQRRAILNRAMTDTNATQDKATEVVQTEAKKYTPADRMAEIQAQEDAAFAQAQQDVGGAYIDNTKGNVSDAYLKAKADKTLSEGNRLTAVARELAKVRAPDQQLRAEGLRRADVAGRTGSMFSSNRNMANAAQLDANAVDAPWWGTLGKIAQAVGGGAMAGGAGVATGAGEGAALALPGEAAAGYGIWDQSLRRAPKVRFG